MRPSITILFFGKTKGEFFRIEQLLGESANLVAQVHHARDIDAGFEQLQDDKIDVVLLHFSWPEYGFELFEKLYQRAAGTPIIVLADQEDEALALKAVQAGAEDFLVDGEVDQNILLRSIRYSMEKNRLLKELEESRRLERHVAYHDFLTGLPNRMLFVDRLEQTLSQARRVAKQVAMLYINLDGFKRINDTLGHGIGDQLLQSAARRLQESVRESDTVARLGADEFAITLFGLVDGKEAVDLARKVRNAMASPFYIGEQELFTTVSIGISMYPADGADAATMIQKGGVAMYRAKKSGKNNYKQYTLAMDATFVEHFTLENSLRRAIANEELVTYFQPQVNLGTRDIMGVEALVRWQHPTLGLVPPDKFIPLAEEIGIIASIDEWVMRSACTQARAWQTELGQSLRVSVNLSAQRFRQKNLADMVATILRETQLSPELLCIEITESNVMENMEHTTAILRTLKALGVILSVDDFGKGYSSLNYLKTFPIDILKVDRSFVSGIPIDRDDMAISTAIVVLAQSMALKVVAEGVETADQLSFFRSLNCDAIQGYYFSPPVPAAEVSKYMSEHRRLLLDEPALLVPSAHND